MEKDVLGQALLDYHTQASTGKLWVHNTYGPKEQMPVDVYFRGPEAMPELEWIALQHCRGRILDIGAGAGSHALALQQMGLDVTALDISPRSVQVLRERGVRQVLCSDFFTLGSQEYSGKFDTLLLLMNGIGLAATLYGLRIFLRQAGKLLRPGGSLVFDSSDIAYMYPRKKVPPMKEYYGEVLYQYEYKRRKSDWFKWLFIDKKTLGTIAGSEGWNTELLCEDKWDQYLVKCQPVSQLNAP